MTTGTNNSASDQRHLSDHQHNVSSNWLSPDEKDRRFGVTEPQLNRPGTDSKLSAKILKDFFRRFFRGFASGVLLHSGVRIVTALLRNPFRKKFPQIWHGIISRDCLRLAMFCALYPSVYHCLVDVFSVLQRRKNEWTYAISGGLAGISVAILDKSKRQTLAFFTVSRAVGAGLSTLVTRGHMSAVPFGEVLAFCACTAVIIYCTALKPEHLNHGYYKSILKWSRDYTDHTLQHVLRNPGPHFISCQDGGMHDSSCVQHSWIDFLDSLPGFAKLYLPIHVTPLIVFRRQMIKDRPLYVLKSLAKNMVLSTLFLGSIATIAKSMICLLRNVSHRPPPIPAFIPLVAGAVCGLALLLERHSRRKELTLFVIPQVLTIFYNIAKSSKRGSFHWLPHGFTLTFALSMMPIMHAYEREPESLTLLINGVLKFFVGQRSSNQT